MSTGPSFGVSRRPARRGPWGWAVLAATVPAFASAGCGTGDFVSPPPRDLSADVGALSPTPTGKPVPARPGLLGEAAARGRSIDVVLASGLNPDALDEEKSGVRLQAGIDKVRARIAVPGEDPKSKSAASAAGNAPGEQARLVLESVKRRPQALIVQPARSDDPELAKAVQAVLDVHVPVVLLGRPIDGLKLTPATAGKNAATPLVLVAPDDFKSPARHMVERAIENAGNAKLDPKGGAILVYNRLGDSFVDERRAAFREALEAAGVKAIHEIPFDRDYQIGVRLLTERLKSDPKPSLVFGAEYAGTLASNTVAIKIAQERPFIQAGFTSEDNLLRMAGLGEFAAIAYYVPTRLVRRAVSTAVALAHQREVPSRVMIEVVMHDSPPGSGVPHQQSERQSEMDARRESNQGP